VKDVDTAIPIDQPLSGWGKGKSTGVWLAASLAMLIAIMLGFLLIMRMGGAGETKPLPNSTQMVMQRQAQPVDIKVQRQARAHKMQAEPVLEQHGQHAMIEHDQGEIFDAIPGSTVHDMEHGQDRWQAGGYEGGGGGEMGGLPLMPTHQYGYSSSESRGGGGIGGDYSGQVHHADQLPLQPLHMSLDTDALHFSEQEGMPIGESERRHSL
jgi:hypothetical protein